ncbi:MAG: benzoate transporter [Gammaproteobacteria bacterium RIFOXYA12_FULL_61_12]|nr:MAG: benzoate transporter [Gammaproteobacteria bacterium RIFOXYA12_FULL_61_12]OGT91738.1 MAG: benzoate transporter [Gammaproteobacteria bacterium RIFOXYD12_FULL_61_37]
MNRRPLSAVIITLNEALHLPACLDSLNFVDEILVVDSGSTDGSQALAESRGCRVISQPWLGYGPQKHFAVEQAANDWVLCIDADEWVSEPLRLSILKALADPRFNVYQMPRCNRFMGRWLRHGEGYPDWSPRLFSRKHAQWSLDPVHEKVDVSGEIGRLAGDLMHESEETLEQYLDKQNRYTSLQAQHLFERGKRAELIKLILSPLLRFFKMYLLRKGFRDGVPGLVHIVIGCFNSHMKYAKLTALYLKHIRSSEVET